MNKELPKYTETDNCEIKSVKFNDYVIDLKTLKVLMQSKNGEYFEIEDIESTEGSLERHLCDNYETIEDLIYFKDINLSKYYSFEFKLYIDPNSERTFDLLMSNKNKTIEELKERIDVLEKKNERFERRVEEKFIEGFKDLDQEDDVELLKIIMKDLIEILTSASKCTQGCGGAGFAGTMSTNIKYIERYNNVLNIKPKPCYCDHKKIRDNDIEEFWNILYSSREKIVNINDCMLWSLDLNYWKILLDKTFFVKLKQINTLSDKAVNFNKNHFDNHTTIRIDEMKLINNLFHEKCRDNGMKSYSNVGGVFPQKYIS